MYKVNFLLSLKFQNTHLSLFNLFLITTVGVITILVI